MNYLSKIVLFVIVALFFVSCSDDKMNTRNGGGDNGGTNSNGGGSEQTCNDMPQFADAQHQQVFSMLGSSCIYTSLYDHNQIGGAALLESDGTPECTVDTPFFKFHMGHASIDDYTLTFDVDVYILTDEPIKVGDEIDLSRSDVHAYYSYFVNNVLKTTKVTSGSLSVSDAADADFSGEFNFEATEFQIDANIDSYVVGSGSFVTDGDDVTVSGRFLAQDQGISPDCN